MSKTDDAPFVVTRDQLELLLVQASLAAFLATRDGVHDSEKVREFIAKAMSEIMESKS